ncbi:MAG TPA: hypothetical protein VFD58_14730 [Blastocatellia bacterium]|nr:hypothetical protein [Blastocatellia bacterium]
MNNSLWPLLLTIGGGVIYHLSSKSVPKTLDPLLAIIAAYLTALVACLSALLLFPVRDSVADSVRGINWAVPGIGIGAAAIEFGFLLSYRAGWQLNVTSIIVTVAVAVVLIPVGFAFLKERLSGWNVLGIVFCLVGLVLISRR